MKVVDLGTGSGGSYLNRDKYRAAHVTAVDRDPNVVHLPNQLRNVDQAYTSMGHAALEYLAQLTDETVEIVQSVLPFDTLLLDLTDQTSDLWSEILRVLVVGGQVDLIIDKPTRGINHNILVPGGKIIEINDAVDRVDQVLRLKQTTGVLSQIKMSQLSRNAVQNLGTNTAITIANLAGNQRTQVYRLQAKKRG